MKKIFYTLICFPFIFSCNKSEKKDQEKTQTNLYNNSVDSSEIILDEELADTIKKAETKLTTNQEELIGKGNPTLVRKDNYALLPEAAKAFDKMKAEAKKAGFNIHVISSYRNFDYQNGIWNRKYNSNSKDLTPEKNIQKIIEYSTIPGTSRHHWGTDLDIIHSTTGIPTDPLNEKHFNKGGSMEKFKEWLDKNSEKYGFYLVYTNNPSRKGFKYEPWHFTYKPLSQKMLQDYIKLDLNTILKTEKLAGSQSFTPEFINQYKKEQILDINPAIK
ncbi:MULTISPECIES: M15 family metallopeptidase [Weeksellaceae]|uniref:M15 family metallopeptidase n=1 Tax=Weeksellaceae TaxID=2762318 RepID=UPI0025C1E3C0|nr:MULTISPECIES: M15 family metallopeptidase [unclassified Empedobacter]